MHRFGSGNERREFITMITTMITVRRLRGRSRRAFYLQTNGAP
jgi:hypothetical protein